jgi:hypothetical protein
MILTLWFFREDDALESAIRTFLSFIGPGFACGFNEAFVLRGIVRFSFSFRGHARPYSTKSTARRPGD